MNNTTKNYTSTAILATILLAGALDFVANWLAAHYLIPVGVLIVPAGTLCFGLAFVTYDFLRRQYGLLATASAVALGLVASCAYAFWFGGSIGRIAVAGIIALGCSSATDLAVQTVTIRWPIWRYVATSNAISLAVDSFVFTFIAFSLLPLSVREQILAGQYLGKMSMTLVAIPLVYAARAALPTRRPQPLAT